MRRRPGQAAPRFLATRAWPRRQAEKPMDQNQQALVRASFAKVAPIGDQAGAMLYENMFAIEPDLRRLFKIDIATQGAKLMAVLKTAIANVDRLDAVMPTVRELGRKHVGYGVTEKDY